MAAFKATQKQQRDTTNQILFYHWNQILRTAEPAVPTNSFREKVYEALCVVVYAMQKVT